MHIVLERNGEYEIVNCFVWECTLSFHSNESNIIYQCRISMIFLSTDFLFNSQIFFSTPEHMCNECFKAQFTSKQLSNSIQMVNGIWQMQLIQLKNNDENTYRTNRKGSASAEQNKSHMQQIWINHQHRLQKMQQLMSFDNLKIWTCGIKESNNRSEQEHQNCEIKQWSRPQQRHSKVNDTWYHYCRQMDMVQTQSTMTQQWQCTTELGVTEPKRLHQTQSWLAYTLECKKC